MNANATPRMSAIDRTDVARLHRQDDREIDYTDIPATDEDFWQNAKLFLPPEKTHLVEKL